MRKTIILSIWDSLLTWLQLRSKPYIIKHVDDVPELLDDNILYIVGESQNYWCAIMLCPCGCRETITLNTLPQVRPRWSFEKGFFNKASLSPSVWRKKGCYSHFFLISGRILWCKNDINNI